MAGTQPGQIPCPSCQAPLALPIEAVLEGTPIVCEGCGLELTAKREESDPALDSLARWYEETSEARTQSAAAGTPLPVARPRRGRRPRR